MQRIKQKSSRGVRYLVARRVQFQAVSVYFGTTTKRATDWWRHNDQKYRIWWRTANVLVIALVVAGIIIPIADNLHQSSRYKLSADSMELIGSTQKKLSDQLAYDSAKKIYQFNNDAVVGNDLPSKLQHAAVGTPTSKDKKTYALDIPEDFSKGVTYHDINSQQSFSLVPQFTSMTGKRASGRLVYPLEGHAGAQAIYTVKSNGLKEDVVLPKVTKDSETFSYNLKVPKTLEARVIPQSGAIGIYSGDPTLFGDISYGSPADQARVQKAQVAADKTNLIFVLPAPVIKTTKMGKLGQAVARFSLSGTKLSVVAENLKSSQGPITIDPSVVVTSASDFQTAGNNEGMIAFNVSGGINRDQLTGGTVPSWTATTAFTTARSYHTSVAYNGYIYVIGGTGAANLNDVQYAPINANGTIGTWTGTTAFTTARYGHTSVAFNGYVYVIGGYDGTTYLNDVQYAPINANGTIGTWTATTAFTSARYLHTSVAYNGYLYVIGGSNGVYLNDVQYAPINANGTIGTWTTTTAFTTARYAHTSVAYNGYLYVIGGYGAGNRNDVQYAPINANGTIGTWTTTTAFTTARYAHTSVAYNGYLYVIGGYGAANLNDVQSAKLNPPGVTASYATTTAFTTARAYHTTVAYNGYLYVIGGYTGAYLNTVQYAPINANGTIGAWTATTAFTTARYGHTSVAYNGYLYVIGGYTGGILNTVQYAPINANGTIGAWTATTAFTTARYGQTSVAYNGYLYVIGGYDGTTYRSDVQYAPINANGTIGTWTTTTAFTNGRDGHASVVFSGRLYVIGGINAARLNDVQYAPINANGTVGAWTATTAFTTARSNFSSVVYNGYLYVIGGNTGTVQNNVQYAPINANGTVGAWTATTAFTTARNGQTSVTYNGYLYVIGGFGGAYYNDVQYAQINNGGSGTTSTFNTTTAFTTARNGHTSVAYNGYLYVIGGFGAANLNDVQYAPINANGTVGAWTATTAFTTARNGHTSVAYNGYLYVIGGYDGTTHLNDVQYAPINANGTVGAWTATTAFTTARSRQTSVTYNGYLYVIGGNTGISSLNDVQYAPINANGTVGAWTATTAFTTARYAHTSVAYNGYLYVIGGNTGTVQNDVQYAPINANGTIGTWTATTAFTTARYNHTSVAYNGYLYVIGGSDGGGNFNDVQYATLNVISRTGRYSKLIDLGGSSLVSGITYTGTLPGGINTISYKGAGADGVYVSSGSVGGIMATACTSNVQARYLLVTIVLDDSMAGAIFPDAPASSANVSTFTVNYAAGRPATNIRLHTGQTLQTGTLSPFDTCGG